MNVSLYTFSKKNNSTAVPSAAPVVYDCILKAGCSMLNPSIGLEYSMAENPTGKNYAYISAFSRYYFVSDWVWENGLWWANLAVDVLATYKTAILNSTEYVARSSVLYDGNIADSLFPTKVNLIDSWVSEWPTQTLTHWKRDYADGFYVIGIINNDSSAVGSVSYYAFTSAQFSAFKNFLMGDAAWTGILSTNPDIGENLYKSLFNPFQYISTINWFPLAWNNNWGTAITQLPFGWWNLTYTPSSNICYRLTTFTYSFAQVFSAGMHPQMDSRGKYTCCSPFTVYRMFAPPWGEFLLDGTIIINGTVQQGDSAKYINIDCTIQVDFISGNGHLIVSANIGGGEYATLLNTQALVAVPIQLAQVNSDSWGHMRSQVNALSSFFGAAASLDVGGMITSAANGIMDGIETRVPHAQTTGSNGGIGIYQTRFQLENLFYEIADDALADMGRPLCKEVLLSTLINGYVKTVNSHIAISGTDSEIENLNAALDRGIFLE